MKGEKGGLNMKKMFLDIWVPTNVTGGGEAIISIREMRVEGN